MSSCILAREIRASGLDASSVLAEQAPLTARKMQPTLNNFLVGLHIERRLYPSPTKIKNSLSMANCYFAKPHGMQHCYITFFMLLIPNGLLVLARHRIIQSRIFVTDCEHEQKTNTSREVHQIRSASLQRHALPLPARASDTTLRPLARLVACPLPAFPCERKRCRNYRSAATAFTTFCTLLRCFDTLPLAGLYSRVLVGDRCIERG
jgi:hypothetical protein